MISSRALRYFLSFMSVIVSFLVINDGFALTMACSTLANGDQYCASTETRLDGTPLSTVTTPASQMASSTQQTSSAIASTSPTSSTSSASSSSSNAGPAPVKVMVTEMIPWATCDCDPIKWSPSSGACPSSVKAEERRYSCTVAKWLGGFQDMFREIVKWVVYTIMLLWVLAISWAGILWMWWSDSEEYTKKAKGWVMNIIIGLLILFTFRYILGFLAPWIFQ